MSATAEFTGEELRVDAAQIEKGLEELRRRKQSVEQKPIARAALWNFVAHATTDEDHARAAATLEKTSAAIPQRAIIIRANPAGEAAISSFVGVNFHSYGSGREIYSEEISILAGGDHVQRVPPLVNSLLIPDMPVGVWWIGDLPSEERHDYVQALLKPADRLIVDSKQFSSAADLALVSRISEETTTAPADLNWVRLEEWRVATASIFDSAPSRGFLGSIRRVRVVSGTTDDSYFGERLEAVLYAAWISAQLGHEIDSRGRAEGPTGAVDYAFEFRRQTTDVGAVAFAELRFEDGSSASIKRDHERGILNANVDGIETTPASITRAHSCTLENLIVRQLKRPESDPVFVKTLPLAAKLAKRVERI